MLWSPCVGPLGQPARYVKPFHRHRMPVESNVSTAATAIIFAVQAAAPVICSCFCVRRPPRIWNLVIWELHSINRRIERREPGCCNQDQKPTAKNRNKISGTQLTGGACSSCVPPSPIFTTSFAAVQQASRTWYLWYPSIWHLVSGTTAAVSWNRILVPGQSARSMIRDCQVLGTAPPTSDLDPRLANLDARPTNPTCDASRE